MKKGNKAFYLVGRLCFCLSVLWAILTTYSIFVGNRGVMQLESGILPAKEAGVYWYIFAANLIWPFLIILPLLPLFLAKFISWIVGKKCISKEIWESAEIVTTWHLGKVLVFIVVGKSVLDIVFTSRLPNGALAVFYGVFISVILFLNKARNWNP